MEGDIVPSLQRRNFILEVLNIWPMAPVHAACCNHPGNLKHLMPDPYHRPIISDLLGWTPGREVFPK